MNADEESELIELLEMNDQDLFDLIFKEKKHSFQNSPI
ncbi:MAG: hypothetical protein CM15mP22_8080 [Gammaproteobacteria bacterium]|nr:MAG: hypothetical protein CM15mP22_8080 [Gammaproteobacteria bacterium]